MSPRPRTYETEEEKAEAHRKRQQKYIEKKRGLKQKLQPENKPIEETENKVEPIIPTQETQKEEPLSARCSWCGALAFVVQRRGGICEFCSQFKSIEEMKHMRQVSRNLSYLYHCADYTKAQIDGIWNEALTKYRSQAHLLTSPQ
jgi:hypothetical protein